MRFGIYAEMQCPDDKPYATLYDEIFEHSEFKGPVRAVSHAT
jgi:hypothetical protein